MIKLAAFILCLTVIHASVSQRFPSLICVTWLSSDCIGGDRALTSTDVTLRYNYSESDGSSSTAEVITLSKQNMTTVLKLNLTDGGSDSTNNVSTTTIRMVDYYFEQLEHGGGVCNCLNICFNCTTENSFLLCNGSASIPRRLKVSWDSQHPDDFMNSTFNGPENRTLPFQLNCTSSPYIHVSFSVLFIRGGARNCNTITNFDEGVEFSVRLLSMPNDWISLKYIYRNTSNSRRSVIDIGDGATIRGYVVDNVIVNGDNVSANVMLDICDFNISDSIQFRWLQTSVIGIGGAKLRDVWILDNIEIYLINFESDNKTLLQEDFDCSILNSHVWPDDHVRNGELMDFCGYQNGLVFSSDSILNQMTIRSRGLLTNVHNLSEVLNDSYETNVTTCPDINSVSSSGSITSIATESTTERFDATPSTPITIVSTYLVMFSSSMDQFDSFVSNIEQVPNSEDISPTSLAESIYSESYAPILTSELTSSFPIEPSSIDYMVEPSSSIEEYDILSTMSHTNTETDVLMATILLTTDAYDVDLNKLSDQEYIKVQQDRIASTVRGSKTLNEIISAKNITNSLLLLQNVTRRKSEDFIVLAYLFSFVVQNLANTTFSYSNFEKILDIAIDIFQSEDQTESRATLTGGITTLFALDFLMFTYSPETGTFIRSNIVLQSIILRLSEIINQTHITSINTSTIDEVTGPNIAMTIPLELLQKFKDAEGEIRIISAVYTNIRAIFFDDSLNNSSIGSDIVASSLQCGSTSCPTSNYTLMSSNVTITFEHSDEVQEMLKNKSVNVSCVFLDLERMSLTKSDILSIGHWSDRGCTRNTSRSSNSMTVCDCNHLTSFAILLSPNPPNFSESVKLSLTVIGYIGVAVSVVAMALTIITFTVLKSLRSMRNYIHVNLCINLSIAQIIFVVGVDKTGPSNSDVPIYCQVIAVLLHYFFLVSFMWMLMEGVVLYVVLVRVFLKHTKRYILAFSIISYGLPAIYVGLLTVPVGFTYLKGYGYKNEREGSVYQACFVNPDAGFMWAFIVPFIVIFLANIGFFIMAARIMWHHQKKQTDNKTTTNVGNWLKSAISLVIVMCLTWIIGVLIIIRSELAPVAYIFTIMVAFQGLFIFLIFVVFSRAVREAYSKWWKVKVSESDFLSRHFGERVNPYSNPNKKKNVRFFSRITGSLYALNKFKGSPRKRGGANKGTLSTEDFNDESVELKKYNISSSQSDLTLDTKINESGGIEFSSDYMRPDKNGDVLENEKSLI